MLSCSYCYLNRREKSNHVLTEGALKYTIDEMTRVGVSIITLAGKEIFFDDKGINILKFLDSLKIKKGNLRYGFITNGYLLPKYLPKLKKIDFDWMDISIDSFTNGSKSYKNVARVIWELANDEVLSNKLTISSILSEDNSLDLLDLSLHLDKIGIKHQTITPNFDQNQDSLVPLQKYVGVFENYVNNGNFKNLKVYFVVSGDKDKEWFKTHYNLKKKFIDSLDQDTYYLDSSEHIFVLFHNPLRYFRLTADGYILQGRDIFQPNYRDFAVGNVELDPLGDILVKLLRKSEVFDYYIPQLKLAI